MEGTTSGQPNAAATKIFTDARLGKPPSEALLRYVHGPMLQVELSTFDAYMLVDLAHTTMLAEGGLIPLTAARDILRALRKAERIGAAGFSLDPRAGSFLFQVERFLADEIGHEHAGYMHLGRSRIDQGAAVNRVYLRDGLLATAERLLPFQEALLARAREHADTLMPGYTHLQHAQPWTFGHYLLWQFETGLRDLDRLLETYGRANLNSLGTAALVGTSWPLDRDRTAKLLGHAGNVRNAKDAGVFAMEILPETAATLSLLMSGLGRLAADFYVWYTWEFGLIDLDEALCGSSSIMPQKKNPYALERVRALAGEAIGWMPEQLGLLKLNSSSDCDIFFSSGQIGGYFQTAEAALGLMAATVETVRVNAERMAERAGVNWSTASNLADAIVRLAGIDFRRAHEVVALLVRQSLDAGRLPVHVGTAELDLAAREVLGEPLQLDDSAVREALDPRAFLATRQTAGSVAPAEMARMLGTAADELKDGRRRVTAERDRLRVARAELDAAIDRLLAG